MSFATKLEGVLGELWGVTPCSSSTAAFSYNVTTLAKTKCGYNVGVVLTVKGCLETLVTYLCKIKTLRQWSVVAVDDQVYEATLLLENVCVPFDCVKNLSEINDIFVDVEAGDDL